MYFLLEACQHPSILRTIYFGTMIKDIIFTIIPIGIVLMTLIDFSKAVIAGKEDEQKKAVKLIPKRIMYAIIVFAIPWIVTILMKTLSNLKLNVATDYQTCIDNAKSGSENGFKQFDEMLEAEEELLKKRTLYEEQNEDPGGSVPIGDNSASRERYLSFVKEQINKKSADFQFPAGQHWCSYFVSYTLKKTKLDNEQSIWDYLSAHGDVGSGARASNMWPGFKGVNGWYKAKAYGGNYTPKPGDIIWFQWDYKAGKNRCRVKYYNSWKKNGGLWDGKTQCSDHIGIVEYVDGNIVHTIEGNYGGGDPSETKVSRAFYNLNSDHIVVYGSWN